MHHNRLTSYKTISVWVEVGKKEKEYRGKQRRKKRSVENNTKEKHKKRKHRLRVDVETGLYWNTIADPGKGHKFLKQTVCSNLKDYEAANGLKCYLVAEAPLSQ